MIRRHDEGEFILITQHDHALLAGELAEHLDRSTFVPLSSGAIQGVKLHDCGWPLHDDSPTVNPRGEPLHVFEIPMQLAVKVWSASAERAATTDPYAGLLVSLHVLALSAFAQQNDHRPHERAHSAQEMFELHKFQHQQIELQEQLRRRLNVRTDVPLDHGLARIGTNEQEDRLTYDFRLLQALDRISLDLCCSEVLFPEIENMHERPGASPFTLRLTPRGTRQIALHPWIFDVPELDLSVNCRSIPQRTYENDAALQREFAAAPIESLFLKLVRT